MIALNIHQKIVFAFSLEDIKILIRQDDLKASLSTPDIVLSLFLFVHSRKSGNPQRNCWDCSVCCMSQFLHSLWVRCGCGQTQAWWDLVFLTTKSLFSHIRIVVLHNVSVLLCSTYGFCSDSDEDKVNWIPSLLPDPSHHCNDQLMESLWSHHQRCFCHRSKHHWLHHCNWTVYAFFPLSFNKQWKICCLK